MPTVSEYDSMASLTDLAPAAGESGAAPFSGNGDEKTPPPPAVGRWRAAVQLYGAGAPLWDYRAEGGANIVVGLPQRCCVLRFPKWTRPGAEEEAAAERRLRRLADYRNLLMGRLLPDDSCQPWQVVCVSPAERDRLAADIELARPVRRRGYTISATGLAMLMEDCALLPAPGGGRPPSTVFSVEIKTKQGFLAADDEPGSCSFCMKQLVKVARGAVPRHSLYCPLDLFSGQFGRVERALHALLDTPQNNMRVFVDGEYVLGGERPDGRQRLLEAVAAAAGPADRARLLRLWTHLMYAALCSAAGRPPPPPPPPSAAGDAGGARCQPGPGPPPDSVLGQLLSGQRLCAAGPTAATQLYRTLSDSAAERRRLQAAFAAPYDGAGWTAACSADADGGGDAVSQLQRYCVGATLRDCSLMVTLRRLGDAEPAPPAGAPGRCLIDADGARWLCLCRLMDLDQKQPERAPRQLAKKQRARRLHARLRGQRRLSDRTDDQPAAALQPASRSEGAAELPRSNGAADSPGLTGRLTPRSDGAADSPV